VGVGAALVDDVVLGFSTPVPPPVVAVAPVLGGLDEVVEPVVVTVVAVDLGAAPDPHPASSQMGSARANGTIRTRLVTLTARLPGAWLADPGRQIQDRDERVDLTGFS
jgi:hypothetical protein